MTSKPDKLLLETEPVARDNNTILTLKRGDQTLSRLTQLIIVVPYGMYPPSEGYKSVTVLFYNCMHAA